MSLTRTSFLAVAATASLGLFLVTGACKSEARTPDAAATAPVAKTKGDKSKRFKLEVVHATLASGAKADAVVSVVPGSEFKWNKDYPAAFKLIGAPTKVSVAKKEFKQLKGDFKSTDKKASVSIPMEGKAAGTETLQAEIRFSICNKTTCLIEKETVAINVKVN